VIGRFLVGEVPDVWYDGRVYYENKRNEVRILEAMPLYLGQIKPGDLTPLTNFQAAMSHFGIAYGFRIQFNQSDLDSDRVFTPVVRYVFFG